MNQVSDSKYVTLVENKSYQIEPIYKDKNFINLVFAFDDKFSKYFAVVLQSLVENVNSNDLYDIVVFTSDLSDKNAKRLLKMLPNNFSLRFFNIKKYIYESFKDIKLKTRSYWSEETYYRLFIPIIMNSYKRVLYLDSDIIINNDIKELFNTDFEGKEVAVMRDVDLYLLNESKDIEKRVFTVENDLGVKDSKQYFNAGILLFNIKGIELNNYVQSFIKALRIKKLEFQDQDVLNVTFYGKAKFLDWKWNMQWHIPIYHKKNIPDMNQKDYQKYCEAFENPVILHFTSSAKPWNNPSFELAEVFWYYARKTIYYEEIMLSMCNNAIIDSAKALNLYIKLYSGKKIVLWGASIFLEQFIRKYHVNTDNIIGIVDKSSEKHGMYIENYKCYAPEDIEKLNPEEIIITIVHYADKREKEIKKFVKQNCSKNIEVTRIF